MPLDTVKTRMQSIEAKTEYKNSFNCAARVVREEGFLTLWSGAVPRLGRLILSGGIVFTMYVSNFLYSYLLLKVPLGTKRLWSCLTSWTQRRNTSEQSYAQTYTATPFCKALHTYKHRIIGDHHTTAASPILEYYPLCPCGQVQPCSLRFACFVKHAVR